MKFTIINLLILLIGVANIKGDVCQVTESNENQYSLCINGQVHITLKFSTDSNTKCTTTCTTTDEPIISPGLPRDPNTLCKDMATAGSFKPDDDETCTKFIVCYLMNSSWYGLVKTCNTGYYFDPATSICSSVKPEGCSTISTTDKPTTSPSGSRDPNTLCKDMATAGSIKPDDDETCTKFIVCYLMNSKWYGLVKTCNTGDYFDPATSTCSSVKPKGCSSISTTDKPTTSPSGFRDPNTLCKDMATTGSFKPDDDETCTKFIVCYAMGSNFKGVVKTCNTGYYFDTYTRMCTPVKPEGCSSVATL